MGTLIKLFLLSIMVILAGTIIMYVVESEEPNSEINSLEDALWWCVATVTTVGYGDVVPVSKVGRYVAIAYMGFGISMITILLSTITNNFYRKRVLNDETKRKKEEFECFKREIFSKLEDLEKKQTQYLEIIEKKINVNEKFKVKEDQ